MIEAMKMLSGWIPPVQGLVWWFVGIIIFGEFVSIVGNSRSIIEDKRIEEHDIMTIIIKVLHTKVKAILNKYLEWQSTTK
jgi:hypothetical protein